MKFSIDEKEELYDFLDRPSKEIVLKILTNHLKDIENNVLRYSLSSGAEGLMIEKARSEGALALLTRFKETLHKVEKSPNR